MSRKISELDLPDDVIKEIEAAFCLVTGNVLNDGEYIKNSEVFEFSGLKVKFTAELIGIPEIMKNITAGIEAPNKSKRG